MAAGGVVGVVDPGAGVGAPPVGGGPDSAVPDEVGDAEGLGVVDEPVGGAPPVGAFVGGGEPADGADGDVAGPSGGVVGGGVVGSSRPAPHRELAEVVAELVDEVGGAGGDAAAGAGGVGDGAAGSGAAGVGVGGAAGAVQAGGELVVADEVDGRGGVALPGDRVGVVRPAS